jgi:chromosome partitioning protein
MRTIAFGIQKGGVGKTSLSVATAARLAKMNHKTLLLDLDPQGQASYWALRGRPGPELADVLFETAEFDEAVCPTFQDKLFCIPTYGVNGRLMDFADEKGKKRQGCIKAITRQAEKRNYDFCIIDLSPGFGCLERNAYIAADEVITPIIPDPLCVDSLELFMANLKELRDDEADLDLPVAQYNRMILNAVNRSFKVHTEIVKLLKEKVKQEIFIVPSDQAFKRAADEHESIDSCGCRPETTAEITKLAEALTEKEETNAA